MGDRPNRLIAFENPWVFRLLRACAWGLGCGIGISIVWLTVIYFSDRPKQWNSHALAVSGVKAETVQEINNKSNKWVPTSTGVMISADVKNTTAQDITIPRSLKVMQAAKSTGALRVSFLNLDSQYFIPAHRVARITLENSDLCSANTDPRICFDRFFKDEKQIVIFDDSYKYEIDIPVPAFTPTPEK